MARRPTGAEALERAREAVKTAETVNELRAAQAVLLPLEFGLNLGQTGEVLGRTPAWVSRTRRAFILETLETPGGRPGRGGRRHALMPSEDELALVKRAMLESWHSPGWRRETTREALRRLLEARINRQKPAPKELYVAAESTLTRMLSRAAATWMPGATVYEMNFRRSELIDHWLENQSRKAKRAL